MEKLPIVDYRQAIVKAVKDHRFTIITAETGSGKSTQVPQFLAGYFEQVIVTEPRVMAAKTLAKRVAEETGFCLGKEVGYRTGFDKCSSPDSKVVYCTDGLQLIRTIFDENTTRKNALVIDEVHEWNLNIETLIAWVRHKDNWNTHVVIMSATMDDEALANYLEEDVAVIHVPGRMFDVTVEEKGENCLRDSIKNTVMTDKNVLVFVPGKKEISEILLWATTSGLDANAMFLPLHGDLDWEEQRKCFVHYDKPKVIVATNVAQTSITIPDVDVVIDTGKEKRTETIDGVQGIYLRDVSQADIAQRRGRAGRTKAGQYILCSDVSIAKRPKYSTPEIQRSLLDRVVLQLAAIGVDAEEMKFFHQPPVESIHLAKEVLKTIGALKDGKVTELGRRIVKIPLSVPFARMIVEAEKYGVVESVIAIAAIMEIGGLLSNEGRYFEYTTEKGSDLLAELDVWNKIKQGYVDFNKQHINKKNFFRIKEHIKKLHEVLVDVVEMTDKDDRDAILKSCLSGLLSHIYVGMTYDSVCDVNGFYIKLDRRSCVTQIMGNFIVGIPKTIEFKTAFGFRDTRDLIGFASRVNMDFLLDIYPDAQNLIQIKTVCSYSETFRAVRVETTKSFGRTVFEEKIEYDENHERLAELKAKYEEENQRKPSESSWLGGVSSYSHRDYVTFAGKQYEVFYTLFDRQPYIRLSDSEILASDENECHLPNGQRVFFCSYSFSSDAKEANLKALRNRVKNAQFINWRKGKKLEYSRIKVQSLNDIVENKGKIGRFDLTTGVSGDEPIYVYGCILLKKNTVSFDITDDEGMAESNTLEALQYMMLKEIEKRYGDAKFSHQDGKKKKVILTDEERKVKKEFDSFVKESLQDLTIEKVEETLEFLEEYFQELMAS